MPELGLAINAEKGTYLGITREWLYWYDAQGKRYLTPEERIEQERQQGIQELILRQLQLKLGNLEPSIEEKIQKLNIFQLNELGIALFNFSRVKDLQDWLKCQ